MYLFIKTRINRQEKVKNKTKERNEKNAQKENKKFRNEIQK